jgi:hypothetical protein
MSPEPSKMKFTAESCIASQACSEFAEPQEPPSPKRDLQPGCEHRSSVETLTGRMPGRRFCGGKSGVD